MNHEWNADLLLTQYFNTPIRFYLHGRILELTDIKTHIYDRVCGIDRDGENRLLHKEDILFAFPVEKLLDVEPYINIFQPIKNLKLERKTVTQNSFSVDDDKLDSVVGHYIALVTRDGHEIQGELQAFDRYHLFMRVGKKVVLIYRNGLFGFREEVASSLTQNNALDELRKKREKWVEANRENGFEDSIKHLLTDLYPDNAHFIYELLQNAEDAGATEVRFVLKKDYATFEHNGNHLFSAEDVDAITSIGFSTKKDDHTSIGKFGIGFKAVFAYTATPEIESGHFHFRIRDMVVPDTTNLFPGSLGEGKTRFVFPFDNPKKSTEKARSEIENNLRKLDANTLLFLSNICKIEYQFPDLTNGYLKRIESTNDKNRIEISTMRPGNLVPDSIHYLRFTKDVDAQDEDGRLKPCRIAIAFSMDKPEKGEWKIKPLNPGQVSIYFPAAKELSNLLFHLHAPFASTVARDSVRDCPANDELRNHISELIAESMTTIREHGLLDVEFLATLPNDKEHIPSFYQPILKRLIEEFNTKKLVPMKQGGHATASGSYRTARGERMLSDLINDQDLATLLKKDSSSPLWIANPPQINQREDNFLSMLDISEWTIEDLIEVLETQSDKVTGWLKEKADEWEWHQQLYALLGDFLSSTPSSRRYFVAERKDRLSKLQIVRCSDGEYRIGSECHFSEDNEMPEEGFNYVIKGVYSSGQNRNQQKKARAFLEEIGVREVDKAERIKLILERRYKDDSLNHQDVKQHLKDMKKFIALVEKEPDKAELFKGYNIFDTTGGCLSADYVYLDSPYLETGLSLCYEDDRYTEKLEDMTVDSPYFSLLYEESDIDLKKLGKFAEALGAKTKLEAIDQRIPSEHPQSGYLYSAPGDKESHYRINEDFLIPEFSILLNNPSIDKSQLIWRTMSHIRESNLKSQYRKSASYESRYGYSNLVHQLRKAKWVPQKEDDSISFVCPCNASIDYLPEGFPYETGQEWLKVIEFGKKTKEHQEEHNQRNQQAKNFGFNSSEKAEKYAELDQILEEHGMSPDDLISQYSSRSSETNPDFPTAPVKNTEFRKERVTEQIRNAPEKAYEERIRNERPSKSDIDQKTSLKEWYTNESGEMVCQICRKVMPFKKTDGEYYFVAIEALTIRFINDQLPENHFLKEFEAQYLALCPECAARYDYFVRTVKDGVTLMEELRNHLINSEDMEFLLKLGELDTSIRFVEAWHRNCSILSMPP